MICVPSHRGGCAFFHTEEHCRNRGGGRHLKCYSSKWPINKADVRSRKQSYFANSACCLGNPADTTSLCLKPIQTKTLHSQERRIVIYDTCKIHVNPLRHALPVRRSQVQCAGSICVSRWGYWWPPPLHAVCCGEPEHSWSRLPPFPRSLYQIASWLLWTCAGHCQNRKKGDNIPGLEHIFEYIATCDNNSHDMIQYVYLLLF